MTNVIDILSLGLSRIKDADTASENVLQATRCLTSARSDAEERHAEENLSLAIDALDLAMTDMRRITPMYCQAAKNQSK